MVGILEWVQYGGKIALYALYVFHDKPLKALHDDRCECNGPLVIQAEHSKFLLHRDDGGHLDAHRNNRLAQGDAENVCKDS